jgi:hypothetical protein
MCPTATRGARIIGGGLRCKEKARRNFRHGLGISRAAFEPSPRSSARTRTTGHTERPV